MRHLHRFLMITTSPETTTQPKQQALRPPPGDLKLDLEPQMGTNTKRVCR